MATQQYIFEREETVITAQTAVSDLTRAMEIEIEANGFGGVTGANRDPWQTVRLNARDLQRRLDALITVADGALGKS
jgi:hypothetical protein